jgi:hypothetical protein
MEGIDFNQHVTVKLNTQLSFGKMAPVRHTLLYFTVLHPSTDQSRFVARQRSDKRDEHDIFYPTHHAVGILLKKQRPGIHSHRQFDTIYQVL